MFAQELLQSLAAEIGCSDRTARSLLETAQEVVGEQIVGIERVETGFLQGFRLRTGTEDYYLTLSPGNVILAIRAGDPKGPLLYREIE